MSRSLTLINETITTAITAEARSPTGGDVLAGYEGLVAQANFTYGAGGTDATIWIQTSFDDGETWTDIAAFNFTTASSRKALAVARASTTADVVLTDGALADDTAVAGLLGNRLRAKLTTTGTYSGGTTLRVDVILL